MKKLLCGGFFVISGMLIGASMFADQTAPQTAAAPVEAVADAQSDASATETQTTTTTKTVNVDDKQDQKIVYVYAQPPAAPAEQEKSDDSQKPAPKGYHSDINDNPLLCFGRGLTNIATCWLEIPRCVIYDTKLIPVVGTIMGIPEGAGYTVVRALSGTADIITFGMDGGTFYGEYLPDFIWQANWEQPKND